MDRYVLTDAQWAKMEPHCLGKPTDPGRSGRNNRLFMEAVLWIVRTGSPWRDLPAHFGNWSTAYRRFRDWREADVFKRILTHCRMIRTWNTPWSMPRSSRFTVTNRAHKVAQSIGQSEDFGRHAATGAADRLRLVPPFPPNAERCALM
jgi:transposase